MFDNYKLEINLVNWRCFDSAKFEFDLSKPLVLVDNNGAGKTSLLSALYTLYTGQPWVNTSFKDQLKAGTDYLGLTTASNSWWFSAKVAPSGRLVSKFECDLAFSSQPKILTYLPTDNYWFYQSRTKKLSLLDLLLSQISVKYTKHKLELDKFIKSKSILIKRSLQDNSGLSEQTLSTLYIFNSSIQNLSDILWAYRSVFLAFVYQQFPKYLLWLQNSEQTLSIDYWVATSQFVNRKKIDLTAISWLDDFELSVDFLINQNTARNLQAFTDDKSLKELWKSIWQRELLLAKVLWGAQRDDFEFLITGRMVQNVLSRGEMRLLVLFIKDCAKQLLNSKLFKPDVYWFLDDVFNELDNQREGYLLDQVLAQSKWYLATSTKPLKIKANQRGVVGA